MRLPFQIYHIKTPRQFKTVGELSYVRGKQGDDRRLLKTFIVSSRRHLHRQIEAFASPYNHSLPVRQRYYRISKQAPAKFSFFIRR